MEMNFKYQTDKKPLFSEADRDRLRFLLKFVTDVFDREGFTYWLDRGTLLGAYREQQIIMGDDDIDLRMMHDEWEAVYEVFKKELPDELVIQPRHHQSLIYEPNEEFSTLWFENPDGKFPVASNEGLYLNQNFHSATALIIYYRTTKLWSLGPNLDLYCCRLNDHIDCMPVDSPRPWIQDKNKYLCIASDKPDQIIPYELVFPLSEIELEGGTYKSPKDVEGYLTHEFGYLGEDAQRNSRSGLWEKILTGKKVYEEQPK